MLYASPELLMMLSYSIVCPSLKEGTPWIRAVKEMSAETNQNISERERDSSIDYNSHLCIMISCGSKYGMEIIYFLLFTSNDQYRLINPTGQKRRCFFYITGRKMGIYNFLLVILPYRLISNMEIKGFSYITCLQYISRGI